MSGPKKSSPRWGLAAVGAAAAVLMLGLATAVVNSSVAGAQAPTTAVSPMGGGQSSQDGSSSDGTLPYTGQGFPISQECEDGTDTPPGTMMWIFAFGGNYSPTSVELHGITVLSSEQKGNEVHFYTDYSDDVSALEANVYVTWNGTVGNAQLTISHGCAGTEESSSSSSSSSSSNSSSIETTESSSSSSSTAPAGPSASGNATRDCASGTVTGTVSATGVPGGNVTGHYQGLMFLVLNGNVVAQANSDVNGDVQFTFSISGVSATTTQLDLVVQNPVGTVTVPVTVPVTGTCPSTTGESSSTPGSSSTTNSAPTTPTTKPAPPTCKSDQVLDHGKCVNKPPVCTKDQVLKNGVCVTKPAPPSTSISLIPPTSATAVAPPTCKSDQVLDHGKCVNKPPVCTKDQVLKDGVCVNKPTVPGPVVKTSQSQGFPVPHTNGTGTIGTSSGTYWTIGSGMGLVLAAAGAMALRRRRQRRA